jgi:formamidopyrimidine-DNA glycosylase
VDTLSTAEIKKLYQVINLIIKQAVKYRGTTFSDYVDSSGQSGNFSKFLRVYGRQGQPCSKCKTIILKKKVAGRGSHYCPHCQK